MVFEKKVPKKYKQKIQQILDILIDIDPVKVVLFGSLACGSVHRNSDIDICVIKETDDPMRVKLRISDLMWQKRIGFEPEVDLHVYSPAVYRDWFLRKDPFIGEIEKGVVLYERG